MCGPRVKPGAIEQTLDILAWLGIDFDGEPVRQSADLEPYREAMRALDASKLIFASAAAMPPYGISLASQGTIGDS